MNGRPSYEMKVKYDQNNYLVVTYWGSVPKDRVFDILINDEIIKTEKNNQISK